MPNLVTNIQGYSIHDGPGIRTVVFFKGCGLECRWCANPECISPRLETGFFKNLCNKCGKCADICREKALVFRDDGFPYIDYQRCTGCGACSEACAYKALVLYGKSLSVEEVFDIVAKDKMFYDASGGGITVSGGEALLQPEPVKELFEKCRKEKIHTCIETSGFVSAAALKQVLKLTDYILYDLKTLDTEKHNKYTGKPNDLILSNAELAAASGKEMLFRMPLIPGINDDEKNVSETAKFIRSVKQNRIELMPYHRLGKGKYNSLGKKYLMGTLPAATPQQIESVQTIYEQQGITCTISR